MKVAVWGAGTIGKALVHRLVTTEFISEVHWINRDHDKVQSRSIDIEHGLQFAPVCRRVTSATQESASEVFDEVDMAVLTQGHSVALGDTRDDVYVRNREVFREFTIPALNGKSKMIVLVITNPVDHLARLLYRETDLGNTRLMGLGTVVDTARLCHSISGYVSPIPHPRDVWAYAVGLHNENVAVTIPQMCAMGREFTPDLRDGIKRLVQKEIANGAKRIKQAADEATLHPVVEGAVHVLKCIALDMRSVLTVSVLDPESPHGLFYSVPCTIGNEGVLERMDHLIPVDTKESMRPGIENAVRLLKDCGDA